MSDRVLAPSNVGYKANKMSVQGAWGTSPPKGPTPVQLTLTATVLASYKSPTQGSDGRAPTNYCRMISKIVPLGPFDCYNNQYRVKGDAGMFDVSNHPYGCDIANGKVNVPQWIVDDCILNAKLEMNQIGANIFEDLGQLKQTGALIADMYNLVIELYLIAVRKQWGILRQRLREAGSNVPRNIANGWLMYFYGIKPLISTIDAISTRENALYRTLKIRKRRETSASPRDYASIGYWVRAEGPAKHQAQCQLIASVRMDQMTRTWLDLGVSSSRWTDAMVTAWALAPYSFVFDWFVPVESWLRSLHWEPTLEYQGGFVGRRHVVDAHLIDEWPWSGQWPYQGKLPTAKLQVRFYQRTTYPYFLPPSFLSLRLSLNSNQILSASALIVARS